MKKDIQGMKKEALKNDVIVIGGGPAGVEAAIAAAPYADSVVIISEGPVGDWGKLMPSRVWLAALDQMEMLKQSPLLRTAFKPGAFDLDLIAAHTDWVAGSWRKYITEELNRKGVQISIGRASFNSPNQVQITSNTGRQVLSAHTIIIASGAVPNFSPGFEPDGERVFSTSTIDQMKTLPKSIIVVGDGPIGFEFVDIFSRLDVSITWIVLAGGPRSGFGTEADEFLIRILRERGVRVKAGPSIECIERGNDAVSVIQNSLTIEAEMAFVNLGHSPNLGSLNLQAAGVEVNERGRLEPDEFGRSNISNIYVAGDAIQFGPGTIAMGQARVAGLHAANKKTSPLDLESTVISFGLNPQVARVGIIQRDDGSVQSVAVPFRATILSHVNSELEGFIRVAWDNEGRVVGGLAIGRNAADALAPIAMAIKTRVSINDLAEMQGPHPNISELPYITARKET